MSFITDILKGNVTGAITPILLQTGKDFIAAVYPEILPLFNEWWEQRSTADGWTDKERLTYLYATVTRIKQKNIGPSWVDSGIDFALQSWLKHMAEDLDKIDPIPIPVPVDPSAPLDVMLTERPMAPPYNRDVHQAWTNLSKVPEAVRFIVLLKTQIGYPGWTRIDF